MLAPDAGEVIEIVRNYIENVGPFAWGDLPAGQRPQHIACEEDVAHWAIKLASLSPSGPGADVRAFFLSALTRMQRLHLPRPAHDS